jgi:prepilin-type N-terminal cleavage/methylation domain-containing protein
VKKHKRKGFTLVELIIVIALFSFIMYSVLQLMGPVSKFFVRSSNFQDTTACMDNIQRAIEGNLKYADRVRVYSGYSPYTYTNAGGAKTSDYEPTADLKDKVEDFYNEFFQDRKPLCCKGSIYVLVFDNTEIISDAQLANLSNFQDYTGKGYNKGKMVLYRFDFNNYNAIPFNKDAVNYTGTGEDRGWYVNRQMYGNFDYEYTFSDFNPADISLEVRATEIRKTENGLVREPRKQADESGYTKPDITATFSMKNVLDMNNRRADGAPAASLDYITKQTADPDILKRYEFAESVARYASMDKLDPAEFDGFYFIYTVPEQIEDIDDIFEPTDEEFLKFKEYTEKAKEDLLNSTGP